MVVFSTVDPEQQEQAFDWHQSVADSNPSIFKRDSDEFKEIASSGYLWCAKLSAEKYTGMAYAHLETGKGWEVGGLVVRGRRERGIGTIISCLTTGHMLFSEDPLARGFPVLAYVLRGNPKPIRILRDALQFGRADEICEPAEKWPNIATEDDVVCWDIWQLDVPRTLIALADWCDHSPQALADGEPVDIRLPEEVSLQLWAEAFRDMAAGSARA